MPRISPAAFGPPATSFSDRPRAAELVSQTFGQRAQLLASDSIEADRADLEVAQGLSRVQRRQRLGYLGLGPRFGQLADELFAEREANRTLADEVMARSHSILDVLDAELGNVQTSPS